MRRFWAWLKGERAKPLRDVGGIVLGVLIALGIGEIADDIRWRFKVRDSEQAMRAELGSIRRTLNERLAMAECINRRLDAIGAILIDAQRGKPVPTIAKLGSPPFRLVDGTAFDVARDEGVSLHMKTDKWRFYVATYRLTTSLYGGYAEPERARWDTLRVLESNPGVIEPGLLSTLQVALAEARAYAKRQQMLARQGDHAIESLGIPIDWTFDAGDRDPRNLDEQRAQVAKAVTCQPLVGATIR